jgi:hypothetical protein
MSIQAASLFELDFLEPLPIVVEVSEASMS